MSTVAVSPAPIAASRSRFASIGHFFATVAHGLVKAGKAVAAEAPKVEAAAAQSEPVVEAITGLLYPAAVPLERMAFQLLGNAVAVVGEAQGAVEAKGINITLDAKLVADLKALGPQFEQLAAAFGVGKPKDPVIAPARII